MVLGEMQIALLCRRHWLQLRRIERLEFDMLDDQEQDH